MRTWAFATFSRRTTFGGAALIATAAVAPPNVSATKMKSGHDCKKNEKKRCSNDAAACRTTVTAGCQNEDGCHVELRCCDECTADGFLTCFVASLD